MKPHTEETKQKMRLARLGKPSQMKGKKHSEETKQKMSLAHRKPKPTTSIDKTITSIKPNNSIKEHKQFIIDFLELNIGVEIQPHSVLSLLWFAYRKLKIERDANIIRDFRELGIKYRRIKKSFKQLTGSKVKIIDYIEIISL